MPHHSDMAKTGNVHLCAYNAKCHRIIPKAPALKMLSVSAWWNAVFSLLSLIPEKYRLGNSSSQTLSLYLPVTCLSRTQTPCEWCACLKSGLFTQLLSNSSDRMCSPQPEVCSMRYRKRCWVCSSTLDYIYHGNRGSSKKTHACSFTGKMYKMN